LFDLFLMFSLLWCAHRFAVFFQVLGHADLIMMRTSYVLMVSLIDSP
jgi:hypothetical protein